ncbi:MAG: site-2 protease family protein [Opitutales bacterium]|nr:site-2 protease family protein [Opitutales bacterium]
MPDFSSIFESSFGIAVMIVFFGGSIFVHEFGHFLAAKWRGLKVLKFSIGFGPKICGWRGKDGCEYRISLLPFGGYVALPQLADMGRLEGGEGRGEGGMTEEERLARSLPKISYFDKMVVSAAGAFFNVLFALALAVVIWVIGLPTSASRASTVVGFVPEKLNAGYAEVPCPAYAAGIRAGDKILEVDSVKPDSFSNIAELIAMGTGRAADGKPQSKLKIGRGDEIFEAAVNPVLVKTNQKTGDEIRMIGVYPTTSMKVAAVMPDSPARQAGMEVGDIVENVGGQKVYSNYQVADILNKLTGGESVKVGILRGGKNIELSVKPQKFYSTKPLCVLQTADGKKALEFLSLSSDKSKYYTPDADASIAVLWANDGLDFLAKARPGDILLKIGGAEAANLSELKSRLGAHGASGISAVLSNPDGTNMREIFLPAGMKASIESPGVKMLMGYEIREERIVVHPGVMEQFKENIVRTWGALKSLASPSSDIGLKHLSGPVGIGRVMYKFSLIDISLVLSFAVLVNINLAILNLLPIPVLDGGHMLIATVSKLVGKPVPEGFVAALQGFFMLFFVGVMFYVLYFDIMRWSGDNSEERLESLYKIYYTDNIDFKK